jgi:hypothetical protein
LASHSLTDKATSWFPLLPEFSAIALDTRREEGTEVKEQRNEIAQLWQRTPGGTTPIYWYKKIQKERERERERENGLFGKMKETTKWVLLVKYEEQSK